MKYKQSCANLNLFNTITLKILNTVFTKDNYSIIFFKKQKLDRFK